MFVSICLSVPLPLPGWVRASRPTQYFSSSSTESPCDPPGDQPSDRNRSQCRNRRLTWSQSQRRSAPSRSASPFSPSVWSVIMGTGKHLQLYKQIIACVTLAQGSWNFKGSWNKPWTDKLKEPLKGSFRHSLRDLFNWTSNDLRKNVKGTSKRNTAQEHVAADSRDTLQHTVDDMWRNVSLKINLEGRSQKVV